MTQRISAQELFDLHQQRLGLRWVAGQSGAMRVLESVDTVARRPSLAGYLNIIYPEQGADPRAPRNCTGSTAWIRAAAGK